jgi:hypothetical protein
MSAHIDKWKHRVPGGETRSTGLICLRSEPPFGLWILVSIRDYGATERQCDRGRYLSSFSLLNSGHDCEGAVT